MDRAARWTAIGIALLTAPAWIAARSVGDDSPGFVAVKVERAALRAAPQADGTPLLAELLQGSAGRVLERKEGFVRVALEGWLKEDETLPIQMPVAAAGAAAKKVEPPREPIAEMALAHHVEVAAKLEGEGAKRVLSIRLEIVTARERPVVVAGSRVGGEIVVFASKRVPGGRIRGDELARRDVELKEGKAEIDVPLADLGAPLPELVIVSARARPGPARELVGAATDVRVAER